MLVLIDMDIVYRHIEAITNRM